MQKISKIFFSSKMEKSAKHAIQRERKYFLTEISIEKMFRIFGKGNKSQ